MTYYMSSGTSNLTKLKLILSLNYNQHQHLTTFNAVQCQHGPVIVRSATQSQQPPDI